MFLSRLRTAIAASAALGTLSAGAAFAPVAFAEALPASTSIDTLSQLRPGQHVWFEGAPRPAYAGEVPMVNVVVSIADQRAYVYRHGLLLAATTVSTGRPGHTTPVGTYPILQKRREHYSNLYNNAPMPYMQRLTWTGIALHGGSLPGYPASHGCIRMPTAFAKKLFSATSLGAVVTVIKGGVADPRYDPTGTPPRLPANPDTLSSERFNGVTASLSPKTRAR